MLAQYRSFNGTVNSDASETRTVEGYAIRFNEESQNIGFYETIDRGALTQDVINKSDIFARFNHREDAVLARSRYGEGSLTLELRSDGLFYRFEAPHTTWGDELLEHIKRGEIRTSSFAFVVSDDEGSERWYKEGDVIKRTIYKIGQLFDVSPTFEGAYLTTTCDRRSLEKIEELNKEEENKPIEDESENKDVEEEIEDRENPTTKDDSEVKDNNENNADEETKEDSSEERNNIKSIKLTKNMNTEFRLLKAINDIANNKTVDEVANAVINSGTEEMRKSGLSYGGQIQIPTSELRSTVTVAAEGEDVVATDLYDILEPLRAKNVLVQAGAKFLTNLVGDVQVPVMGAGNVTWEGETATARDAGYTFGSKKLSPKRLTAYVDISKQFLVQDSKSAEALIRQDLINAINSKLEETILGSAVGSTTKPQGIFYLASGTLDVVDSYAEVAEFEATIEDANVNGECKYIMSNKAKAQYRTMIKGTNGTGMVYEGGAIDGTSVLNTSNVEGYNVAYGDWSNLAIGQWGAIDLTVDPYTKAADGQVRLVINAYFDAKVLRPEAIKVAKAKA